MGTDGGQGMGFRRLVRMGDLWCTMGVKMGISKIVGMHRNGNQDGHWGSDPHPLSQDHLGMQYNHPPLVISS